MHTKLISIFVERAETRRLDSLKFIDVSAANFDSPVALQYLMFRDRRWINQDSCTAGLICFTLPLDYSEDVALRSFAYDHDIELEDLREVFATALQKLDEHYGRMPQ
ncbi:MAG: hypothetical protein JSR78_09230 [Proteobacteria bacterium]|nr:hypothetical protein [Pseudomonadota bacterium]